MKNPLKKIDRYLLSLNLKAFFFTALLFSLISVVIDTTTKLDPIIENNVSFRDAVLQYYIHFVTFINGMLWPIFALIAVIFVTSRLAKNSEIISLLNAGIGFGRIMVPFIASGLIIFSMHMFANHFVIPLGAKERIPFENERLSKHKKESNLRNIHALVDQRTKLYMRQYRERDSTALDLRLEHYSPEGELISFLEANRARWRGDYNWEVKNYTTRDFDDLAEHVNIVRRTERDTLIQFSPDEIIRIKNHHQIMTTPELKTYIAKQKTRGLGGTRTFETELYRRSAEPFSILILTIIGMAVASRKVRGGMGLHLAVGVMLGALFIVISRFSMTFSNADSIEPVVGVWIPNFIFSGVALYLIRTAQK
ncbi:MAG: LptF/LptG family permease [Saprospiraceae bacterium]|nr:LptF/LptG family permease [Saprospiraceae bacterium]